MRIKLMKERDIDQIFEILENIETVSDGSLRHDVISASERSVTLSGGLSGLSSLSDGTSPPAEEIQRIGRFGWRIRAPADCWTDPPEVVPPGKPK